MVKASFLDDSFSRSHNKCVMLTNAPMLKGRLQFSELKLMPVDDQAFPPGKYVTDLWDPALIHG